MGEIFPGFGDGWIIKLADTETRLSPKAFSQKMNIHVSWKDSAKWDLTLTQLKAFFQGQCFTERKVGKETKSH